MGIRKDGRPDQVRESECEIDVDIGTELSHLTKTDRSRHARVDGTFPHAAEVTSFAIGRNGERQAKSDMSSFDGQLTFPV